MAGTSPNKVLALASVDSSVVARLARNNSIHVRRAAAANPHCPAGSLSRLAVERDVTIRRCVAANPSANEDTLSRLANFESSGKL